LFTSNWQQAIEQFQAAKKLDSRFAANNADWHDGLEDAIASARSALDMTHTVGLLLFATGRLEQALAELRKNSVQARAGTGNSRLPGCSSPWSATTRRTLRSCGWHPRAGIMASRSCAGPPEAGQSDAALARLQTRSGDKIHSIRIAEALRMRGLHDEAFATLHRARDALERDESILARIGFFQNELIVSPFLGPLYRDRRWQELVAMPEGDSAEEIIEQLWPSSRTAGIERPH
jgi:tetratricopeptide (TPR) repeat protein